LEAKAEPPLDAGLGPSSGMSGRGRPRRAPDGGPSERAQRNVTDPDSRVLKTRDGVIQGYKGQLAVDRAHQIIVAQRPTTNGSDHDGLVPLRPDPSGRRQIEPGAPRPLGGASRLSSR
jgi:hypothetical protein